MKTNILTGILGTTFLVTGLAAFFASEQFFESIGDYYGVYNMHFVKDAGISFFSAGFLLLLSLRIVEWRTPLTLGGALWIILHGCFHIQMLFMGMIPTGADIAKEIALVITPAALTGLLLALRIRESKDGSTT